MIRFSFFYFLLVLQFHSTIISQQPCAKWGNTFDVSLESNNVIRDCNLPDGRKICCAAISNNTNPSASRGVGANYIPKNRSPNANKGKVSCTVQKQYFSSPQELRELAEAKRIEQIPGDQNAYMIEARYDALMKYVTLEEYIHNSTVWLARVKAHMSSAGQGEGEVVVASDKDNAADREFLSRFEFTRTCSTGGSASRDGAEAGGGDASAAVVVTSKWTEWIEPVGITARHPFGFGKCRQSPSYYGARGASNPSGRAKPRVGRSDVDYVLLQSGAALHRQTHAPSGRRFRNAAPALQQQQQQQQQQSTTKHYLFDAGTSTFDSSLFWFTCAYSQRAVSFDQVFGWEMTLLEPVDYWRRVPPKWKPYWHFHNVPISSSLAHPDSPLRYIQQLAQPGDFVALKLDIDHPDMEMPIALMLRDSPEVFRLVDEFFFELHFRCEVMTSCGWGKRVPAESHGLELVRSKVLQYFIDLRLKSGIRAHIWP